MDNNLASILNSVKRGFYDKSPVSIGDLTLKIGNIVDKQMRITFEDNEKNNIVKLALEILIELAINVNSDTVWGIEDAICHKIEYLIRVYREFIPEDIWRSYYEFLENSKNITLKAVKSLPNDAMIDVLQRVVETDEQGITRAHYEIVKIPRSSILLAGGIPVNRTFAEKTAPQPWPKKIDPKRPSTETRFEKIPPTNNNNHDTPKKNGFEDVDVWDFVFIALLRSVIQTVKAVPGGVQLFIKPTVLEQTFEKYTFCYKFATQKNTDTNSVHFWNQASTSLGGDSMSGIMYVCQILERIALAPQIGNDNSIIVRGEGSSVLLNINDYNWLYRMYLTMTSNEYEALQQIQASKPITQKNASYTAFNAYQYWQTIGDWPNQAARMMSNGYGNK